MKLSASQEDYLETIVQLTMEKGFARVSDIAINLGVAKPSVTAALRMLGKNKLVNYEPYEQVTLTEHGRILACQITKRHEELTDFFTKILQLPREQAENNACRIEHVIDDKAMRRLNRFIQFMNNSQVPANKLGEAFREHCIEDSAV